MPYRTALVPADQYRPGFLVRWWHRWIGKLVYGGEETCGHCKFWKARYGKDRWDKKYMKDKGDCKLMFGEEDTRQHDTCARFKPRRRYMHRIRSDETSC